MIIVITINLIKKIININYKLKYILIYSMKIINKNNYKLIFILTIFINKSIKN